VLYYLWSPLIVFEPFWAFESLKMSKARNELVSYQEERKSNKS